MPYIIRTSNRLPRFSKNEIVVQPRSPKRRCIANRMSNEAMSHSDQILDLSRQLKKFLPRSRDVRRKATPTTARGKLERVVVEQR